ncbi:MAG TPA: alpha/beta hydrolase [Candidatus Udaeobacter sp.]|nr:alpha/beta hydrolase [Candidatus Udaeobacter sp.]
MRNVPTFTLHGRWALRLHALSSLRRAYVGTLARRILRGRLRPGWRIYFETGVTYWREAMGYALGLGHVRMARRYLDVVQFAIPLMERIRIQPAEDQALPGRWFLPEKPQGTILYFHGGGFAFDVRSLDQLIVLVTVWTNAAVFVPTYRLAPEHPFPAQQEDALAAYRWLLRGGSDPLRLVLVGDSAGGNLALCLLRRLRREGLPMPAAAVCLSPWTDLANGGESMTANEPFDLIDRRMAAQWTAWYAEGRDPKDPEVSPLYADFAGFPPVYIQAGGAEIMIDMIRAYAKKARQEGADVTLDVWEHMIHNFQAFGDRMEESEEALGRIRDFVAAHMGSSSSGVPTGGVRSDETPSVVATAAKAGVDGPMDSRSRGNNDGKMR